MEGRNVLDTVGLFPVIDAKLISFLRSLRPDDWNRPTIAKRWTVKDIAAHLLDGNLRTLSFSRDKHTLPPDVPINSYADLVAFLNKLNADWVNAAKRLSTNVLVELLESSGHAYCEHLASLDLHAQAIFAVSWAGEEVSQNWFHIAREYTEKFIHQQQIRAAFNDDGLMTKELFFPFIDTFMYGLPHTFRNVEANRGTAIKIRVTSAIGGTWYLLKEDQWKLGTSITSEPVAEVVIPPDTAWKVFSKGVSPADAKKQIEILGDTALGAHVLNMVSVMA